MPRSSCSLRPAFRAALLLLAACSLTPASFAAGSRGLTPPPDGPAGVFAPVLTVSPGRVQFEDTPAGRLSEARTVVVSNTGARPLEGLTVDVEGPSGAFRLYSGCPSVLAPGASCAVMLRFAPSVAGPHFGVLRLIEPATSVAVELFGQAPEGPGTGPFSR